MNAILKRTLLVLMIVVGAVVIDQIIKLYIATHFALGESHEITSWFWLCFVENNGMAFGIEWFSKLALTLFRLLAVGLLTWYTHVLIHHLRSVGQHHRLYLLRQAVRLRELVLWSRGRYVLFSAYP